MRISYSLASNVLRAHFLSTLMRAAITGLAHEAPVDNSVDSTGTQLERQAAAEKQNGSIQGPVRQLQLDVMHERHLRELLKVQVQQLNATIEQLQRELADSRALLLTESNALEIAEASVRSLMAAAKFVPKYNNPFGPVSSAVGEAAQK